MFDQRFLMPTKCIFFCYVEIDREIEWCGFQGPCGFLVKFTQHARTNGIWIWAMAPRCISPLFIPRSIQINFWFVKFAHIIQPGSSDAKMILSEPMQHFNSFWNTQINENLIKNTVFNYFEFSVISCRHWLTLVPWAKTWPYHKFNVRRRHKFKYSHSSQFIRQCHWIQT